MPTDPTYQYRIEDIRRYLSGSMSPAEMHEMEKAALTDPLLADALDGYRGETPSVTDRHLNEIRSLVTGQELQKTSVPPVVVMHKSSTKWWRGLAAAAVIGIMATGAWFFMKPERSATVAPVANITRPAAPPEAQVPAETVETADSLPAAATKMQQLHTATAEPSPPRSSKKSEPAAVVPQAAEAKAVVIDGANIADVPAASQTELLQGKLPPANAAATSQPLRIRGVSTLGNRPSENPAAKELSPLWAGPIGATAKAAPAPAETGFRMAKNQEQSYYLGKVTDTSGAPIPGVTITSPLNYSTLSNVDGSFRLPAQDSAGDLAFTAPGYGPRIQKLLAGKTAGVQLTTSDAGLNEVVVVGYGKQKKSVLTGSISSHKVDTLPYKESPYPQGGWDSFYNNLTTEMGVKSSANKDLHLRFSVENGLPEKFTVIKAPDEATAQKAISIIKKGPKWKTSKRKKKVDVKMKVD